jgi:hypothetical protein
VLTFSSSLGNENWAVTECSGKTAFGFVAGILIKVLQSMFSCGRESEDGDNNGD